MILVPNTLGLHPSSRLVVSLAVAHVESLSFTLSSYRLWGLGQSSCANVLLTLSVRIRQLMPRLQFFVEVPENIVLNFMPLMLVLVNKKMILCYGVVMEYLLVLVLQFFSLKN